jgi:acylphosphatase
MICGASPVAPTFKSVKKQIHAYYSGRVQGVGFRFTAGDIARRLGITGWVKNLHNGSVEIIAEAEEDKLKEFLDRINQHFSRYIQDSDIQWLAATEEFKGFDIEF